MSLHLLLEDRHRVRARAVRELPPSDDLVLALRRVLFTDHHAEVRAAAARRLADLQAAGHAHADLEAWLLESLGDTSPLVRDALLRALARVGGATSVPALRSMIAHDAMWWIRRSAIYTLAAVAPAAEVATFTAALADPFWRVRQAAVKVLAVLGARDLDVRDEVLEAPPSSTLTFLRASWGPVAIDQPARAASENTRLPEPLRDPDPAVVVKRILEGHGDRTPASLVELLCDPHAPLRSVAVERILRARDRMPAFEAALEWLEEPRIPHVVGTVHDMLDRVGDPIAALVDRVLARDDRPGAARWAIGWVVATRFGVLYDAAVDRARRGDASLRRAALRLASDDELLAWAAEPALHDAIAVELHGRHTESSHAALARLDGTSPQVRSLQVDAAARRGAWHAVAQAAADPAHGPRAIATRWLVRKGHAPELRPEDDRDPAVREAGLTVERAMAVFAGRPRADRSEVREADERPHGDRDPFVRRAAIELIARSAPADGTDVAITIALADADPWVRAVACSRTVTTDAALALVVGLLGDREAMVRAAAHGALQQLAETDAAACDARLRALLPGLPDASRRMALAWLSRDLDDTAAAWARSALAGESDRRARELLAAVAGIELEPRIVADESPFTDEEVPFEAPRAAVERRPFGRAGFDVAPLAISGAYDLALPSLEAAHAAGADLFFWEPGYDLLAKFLRGTSRRDSTRVITGTYHADARSIRADVDTALRRLRRDTLDVFLLFWARSPARLDDEAHAIMDGLRRAGKVRAIGFSTHHRSWARAALERADWDVAMVRHSAAHPGIESELLPTARERGAAILTFSALTYGRMLTGPSAPTAPEAYRYTLSQPGVTACISAPRVHRELVENLAVLGDPVLPAARMAELRAFGSGVRVESQRFNTLLRQPTRDAAAAAREMLAAELPPNEVVSLSGSPTDARLPQSSGRRRSKTRLGGVRKVR